MVLENLGIFLRTIENVGFCRIEFLLFFTINNCHTFDEKGGSWQQNISSIVCCGVCGGFRKFIYLLIVVRLCGIDFLLSFIINIFIFVDVS